MENISRILRIEHDFFRIKKPISLIGFCYIFEKSAYLWKPFCQTLHKYVKDISDHPSHTETRVDP